MSGSLVSTANFSLARYFLRHFRVQTPKWRPQKSQALFGWTPRTCLGSSWEKVMYHRWTLESTANYRIRFVAARVCSWSANGHPFQHSTQSRFHYDKPTLPITILSHRLVSVSPAACRYDSFRCDIERTISLSSYTAAAAEARLITTPPTSDPLPANFITKCCVMGNALS